MWLFQWNKLQDLPRPHKGNIVPEVEVKYGVGSITVGDRKRNWKKCSARASREVKFFMEWMIPLSKLQMKGSCSWFTTWNVLILSCKVTTMEKVSIFQTMLNNKCSSINTYHRIIYFKQEFKWYLNILSVIFLQSLF